uniref:Glycosyl hydrolase family 13 catalytic domain-containing protein n=2 Tax=Rhodosorus marinus TaxID=101924 RepID=A0A7S2ZCJ1_9RHOD|mmetsp:Transcript_14726/g.59858  ORF Transcript_14726/g.59858 Transcript_14726/m.59858 type:complete len:1362 (+) Transcript_14726:487-4572(+)
MRKLWHPIEIRLVRVLLLVCAYWQKHQLIYQVLMRLAGSVFELAVGSGSKFPDPKGTTLRIEAKWGEWCEKDTPSREIPLGSLVRGGQENIYIVEGEEAVFTSIADFGTRFVVVNVENIGSANLHLATFEDGDRAKDVFPASQYRDIFLVDTMGYGSEEIGISVVDNHSIPDRPQLVWTPDQGVDVSIKAPKFERRASDAFESSPLNQTLDSKAQKQKRLTVLYHRFDGYEEDLVLTAWSQSNLKRRLRIKERVAKHAAISSFEFSPGMLPSIAASGLSFAFECVGSGATSKEYRWQPEFGYHVFLLEGMEGPVTFEPRPRQITYHRLGVPVDSSWQLEVTCDEWKKLAGSSQAIVPVPALSEKQPGLFELSDFWFPPSSKIMIRPVKTREDLETDGPESTKLYDMTDCWREVPEDRLEGEMHLSQGYLGLFQDEPDQKVLNRERYFYVEYRRYDDDGAGWDIWTWDNDDDFSDPVAAQPVDWENAAYPTFRVDRSLYGSGREILLIGRQGGEHWTAKDEPQRMWKAEGRRPNFVDPYIFLQGHPHLVRRLEDAIGNLSAYVETDGTISLHSSMDLKWFHPNIDDSSKKSSLIIKSANGKAMKIVKVERKSSVLRVIHVDIQSQLLDEDFRVEDFTISARNFSPEVLTWRRYDNFDEYFYEGDLGLEFGIAECTFRTFAPGADHVSVVIYDTAVGPNGGGGRKVHPMRRIPQGCWKANIKANLKGKYYKLLAEGSDKRLYPGVEVIDPYSRCNTAHHTEGRGLIYPMDNTRIADRPKFPTSASVIYELHLRDSTIDPASGVNKKGKFMGLTERGTSTTVWDEKTGQNVKISTALEHILEMGVNTVQIMPIQDFDNDENSQEEYRWGYMPVHFNSPDGWYASSTSNFSRVVEFKKLVDCFHSNGIKVVMDVVYNHTSEDPNEFNLEARFSFNGLAPRYYYRNCVSHPVAASGHNTCAWHGMDEPHCGTCYSNGSGCGNEFRSDAPMGRKFIIDSLKFWVEEYKIDGFRFDLMGLIDQETMTQATAELKKIDDGILIYGEPWTGGPSPIVATVKGFQRDRGFGVFNDSLRDALRGGNWGIQETFLMDGGEAEKVKRGIMGSIEDFASQPTETINYAECHDNRTLWDQFSHYRELRTDSIVFTDSDFIRMGKLAALIIFTSQGLPFIQIGQEMCRTKGGVENSYESPDSVNMVQWKWKQERRRCVEYYKGLIKMRLAHQHLFAMTYASDIRKNLIFFEELGLQPPERCIAFRISSDHPEGPSKARWSQVVVLLNPTPLEQRFWLPNEPDFLWGPVADDVAAGTDTIGAPVQDQISVRGRSGCVLRRISRVEEPAYDATIRASFVSSPFESGITDAASRNSLGLP